MCVREWVSPCHMYGHLYIIWYALAHAVMQVPRWMCQILMAKCTCEMHVPNYRLHHNVIASERKYAVWQSDIWSKCHCISSTSSCARTGGPFFLRARAVNQWMHAHIYLAAFSLQRVSCRWILSKVLAFWKIPNNRGECCILVKILWTLWK